jgi:hypothetical protein
MTPGGSVLLEAFAPPDAVISTSRLLNRDHYGENEFIVDRRKLHSVKILLNGFTEMKIAEHG